MSNVLDAKVESLPGIGPVSGAALRERGISRVGDLLWLLPRRYDDLRDVTPIGALVPGAHALTEGVVRSVNAGRPRGRRRMVEVRLEPRPGDPPGRYGVLRLVWFRGVPGLQKRFPVGTTVRVAGRVDEHRGTLSVAHPEILSEANTGITPRYPGVRGVTAKALAKAIGAAVQRAQPFLNDAIPADIREREGLMPIAGALREIHLPEPELPPDALEALRRQESPAHLRLAFEEFFVLELALSRRRAQEAGVAAHPCAATAETMAAHAAALPFELTDAQSRALAPIREDLSGAEPMRRLLQGDVGSGKTAVAMLAAAQVAASGHQAAFVAPTEVLAEQHMRAVSELAEGLGLRPVLLAGKLKAAERRARLEALASGEANLAVGTHALMGEGVRFHSLALAVVDEQHRFGVSQRLALIDKAEPGTMPHLLVMTATPIPRTLALVVYADLSASVIDALPPGRSPIITRRYPDARRGDAYRQVERALEAGGRAFVVCPAIGDDDDDTDGEGLRGVVETAKELSKRFGKSDVAVLHGRVHAETRREVMTRFREGDVRVLVATTVIEVGVDVPDANVMLVEQAERFGLAQLHQLRGRVGRGTRQSACLLVHGDAETLTPDAELRLAAMCETQDGFVLAEKDLEIRGPGQLFGTQQAGAQGFRFGDLRRDLPRLTQARALARRLLDDDPELVAPEHAGARRALADLISAEVVAEESG